MPGWTETHLPDIGVMLVDLLAYVGDQLSYYQDAVATEAYLGTARQRISLRRHARLVDYRVHEGCNARAWVTIAAAADYQLALDGALFCTAFPNAPAPGILQPGDFAKAPAGSCTVFEPLWPAQSITLRAGPHGDPVLHLGRLRLLPADRHHQRHPGRFRARRNHPHPDPQSGATSLIFEEVIGPHTGNPADADPHPSPGGPADRGHTPRSTRCSTPKRVACRCMCVTWCAEDALTFPLCLSAVMPAPDCSCRERDQRRPAAMWCWSTRGFRSPRRWAACRSSAAPRPARPTANPRPSC